MPSLHDPGLHCESCPMLEIEADTNKLEGYSRTVKELSTKAVLFAFNGRGESVESENPGLQRLATECSKMILENTCSRFESDEHRGGREFAFKEFPEKPMSFEDLI